MEASTTLDWKAEARDLRDQGLSERAIAEAVGKAPSSVHEALAAEPPTPQEDREASADFDAGNLSALAGDSSGEEQTAMPTLPGFEEWVGGNEPTGSTIRLLGGAIEISPPPGGFKKGATYVVRVEARCDEIGFRDERDAKTGQVVGTKKATKLKITDAELA